jgi:NADH-quinone oxidoreductase subunit N
LSLYYYVRVVVFMWVREPEGVQALPMGPALTAAVVVAVVGTILFGLYPGPLFELANASSAALGRAAF